MSVTLHVIWKLTSLFQSSCSFFNYQLVMFNSFLITARKVNNRVLDWSFVFIFFEISTTFVIELLKCLLYILIFNEYKNGKSQNYILRHNLTTLCPRCFVFIIELKSLKIAANRKAFNYLYLDSFVSWQENFLKFFVIIKTLLLNE